MLNSILNCTHSTGNWSSFFKELNAHLLIKLFHKMVKVIRTVPLNRSGASVGLWSQKNEWKNEELDSEFTLTKKKKKKKRTTEWFKSNYHLKKFYPKRHYGKTYLRHITSPHFIARYWKGSWKFERKTVSITSKYFKLRTD
jgi:hypothetical protein